jgi:translocation and assembly module TamB
VEAKADLSTGHSHLRLAGSARSSGGTNDLLIKELSFTSTNKSLLDLEAPVPVRLVTSSPSAAARSRWELHLPRLRMRGPDRELSLEADLKWPDEGISSGQIHGIILRDFDDFLPPQWHPVRLDDVQFKMAWQRGPITLAANATGSYTGGPGFTAHCDLLGNASGLVISNLTVSSQLAPVISARGSLPLVFNPANPTNLIVWARGQSLDFKADMQPDPQFWQRLSQFTGIEVMQPTLAIDISGPFNSPTGSIHGSALKLNLHQTNRPLPGIENLRLDLQFDGGKLRVEQFRFLVEKQPVSITAELPIDAQLYESLARRKTPNLERASARIILQHAPIAAFTRHLPKILMPLGMIDMDVGVKPGMKLAGEILLTGATTEPLGQFGAIRDINAQIVLQDRSLDLKQLSATIGGQPIHAAGTADLSDLDWLQGALPPFSLKLNGQNLPLVREPKVIIRADLDITIVHTKTNQPVIAGLVTLRNSFYVSDLESLFPGTVTKPSERPPWFSIEAEPLANWRLDCRVKGDKFLKVQTPFFRGTISADFKLEGTLKEPVATGQATASSGQIDFPFGSLDLRQAILSLTAANPYQPGIYATARARRFGYDITLEVTGSADKPIFQFSSVPSLSSDQILLLLTAGQLPRDELSLTPQQKAQRFALFLGQRLLSKFGFTGTSERLTIRSGEDISESGRATYDVEYKLDRNWSIVGQYDRFNAFNLSLKRKIYSH